MTSPERRSADLTAALNAVALNTKPATNIEIIIKGGRPAFGKQINALIRDCDLGIEGAFIHDEFVYTASTTTEVTEDYKSGLVSKIKILLEGEGWMNVTAEVSVK